MRQHQDGVNKATKLARENHFRYVVLARRWPAVGWVYYYAPVGSRTARALREWRSRLEAGQRV